MIQTEREHGLGNFGERVNHCPCGEGIIHLFKGSQVENEKHNFLKGSKEAKERLKCNDPDIYATFKLVWDVRSWYIMDGLPKQYIFLLVALKMIAHTPNARSVRNQIHCGS